MWKNEETPLPDESDPALRDTPQNRLQDSSQDGWLADKIVSVTQQPSVSGTRDPSGLRLEEKGQFLRLQFVSVYVRDQDRSLEFFRDKLGFNVVLDVLFASGNRYIQVTPPDGSSSLALVLPRPGSSDEELVGKSGSVSFIAEDVVGKYKEWSNRGVKFSIPPQTPAWGGTFCRFEDPDGNPFGLVGFDEMNREIEARRRAHAERLEAERRAAQELEIAKQVQARLFPQRLPPVPSLDYAGLCIQARSVGGDYYDFLELGKERIGLVVGDIAGKGIAGALLMANLQANLRSQCVHAVEHPERVLRLVNRQLFENTDASAYATLFFAEFDHRTGRLRYANCGHLPALLLCRDGAVNRLDPTSAVIGMFHDWQCTVAESQINPGDTLVLYTDGVTESFNTAEEEFGEERLIEALHRHSRLNAHQLAGAIVDEVKHFSGGEQFDDITLIVAKRIA
jgi:serine phosphatase RsbU (regulator of sigma subunit)/uncharacterized glyoxalase superfamily protein PhnB